jgi:hypothetical protein
VRAGAAAVADVRPVTKASGKPSFDHRRYVHNRVLGAAEFIWVLPLTQWSPAARCLDERHRQAGDRHGTATRRVGYASAPISH